MNKQMEKNQKKRHLNTGIMNFVIIPVLYACLILTILFVISFVQPFNVMKAASLFVAPEPPVFNVNLKIEESYVSLSEIDLPSPGESYAVLRIPNAKLEKELYYGDDEHTLHIAVGQYANDAFPGMGKPILLAGHNGTHFKQLRYAEIGDLVEIETNYGIYQYQVVSTEIVSVENWDASQLDKNEELLMMYTCYPFDQLNVPDRYFVYAKFIDGPEVKEDR